MNETIKLLENYNKKIISIYLENNLLPLSGLDHSYILSNGKQLLVWENEITRHRNCSYSGSLFNYTHLLDDILICSDEILYFTAHLFLYRPYINNPLKEGFETDRGTTFFPNNINTATRRYQMFTNVCYEKVYNFWDRIGDLIASYFPTRFTGNIYFSNVIDNLQSQFRGNPNFDWLLGFRQNEYKMFNEERKKSVHNISLATEHKWEQLNQLTNEAKTKELFDKISSYPEKFKEIYNLSKEGLVKALAFLEFLNNELGYECPC